MVKLIVLIYRIMVNIAEAPKRTGQVDQSKRLVEKARVPQLVTTGPVYVELSTANILPTGEVASDTLAKGATVKNTVKFESISGVIEKKSYTRNEATASYSGTGTTDLNGMYDGELPDDQD